MVRFARSSACRFTANCYSFFVERLKRARGHGLLDSLRQIMWTSKRRWLGTRYRNTFSWSFNSVHNLTFVIHHIDPDVPKCVSYSYTHCFQTWMCWSLLRHWLQWYHIAAHNNLSYYLVLYLCSCFVLLEQRFYLNHCFMGSTSASKHVQILLFGIQSIIHLWFFMMKTVIVFSSHSGP